MFLYLFLLMAVVFVWAGFITCAKEDKDTGAAICFILGLFGAMGFIGCSIHLSLKNADAENLMSRRDYYQELVTNLPDNLSLGTTYSIISSAEAINSRIMKNRKNCGNILYGSFYNRKIAEIELIEIPDLYLKDFDEKDERDL